MIKGIIITFIIATISVIISYIHPSLDALAISIIFGMLTGNLIEKSESMKRGIKASMKIFIPLGIILYGSQLILKGIEREMIFITVLVFLFTFSITYIISVRLRLRRELTILLSTGISVCGASAIAIISKLIPSKEEETSISIVSIMVAGLLGLLIYPLIWDLGYLSENGFSLFTGTTLPMLGQVKITGKIAGDNVMLDAINIKLLRISMLVPLIIWFGMIYPVKSGEDKETIFPFTLRLLLISGFTILVIMTNTLKVIDLNEIFELPSKLSLTIALTAIGLNVDFDSISEIGAKPLYTVIAVWIIVAMSVFIIARNL